METDEKETEKRKDRGPTEDKHDLKLIVHSPRAPEPKTFTWAKTTKVGLAASLAATAFGYAGGNPGLVLLSDPPRTLDNNKTLVAEHLKDDDQLEITDTGGGV